MRPGAFDVSSSGAGCSVFKSLCHDAEGLLYIIDLDREQAQDHYLAVIFLPHLERFWTAAEKIIYFFIVNFIKRHRNSAIPADSLLLENVLHRSHHNSFVLVHQVGPKIYVLV